MVVDLNASEPSRKSLILLRSPVGESDVSKGASYQIQVRCGSVPSGWITIRQLQTKSVEVIGRTSRLGPSRSRRELRTRISISTALQFQQVAQACGSRTTIYRQLPNSSVLKRRKWLQDRIVHTGFKTLSINDQAGPDVADDYLLALRLGPRFRPSMPAMALPRRVEIAPRTKGITSAERSS